MLGLTVHGEPRPIDAGAIANALGARFAVLPENYLQLMTRWGAGWLCGVFELPDPSEPTGRFDLFGDSLRVNGPAQRRAGQWAQLADDELARGVVLGVDRYGRALFAVSPAELVLLAPNGTVRRLGTFERVISHYLLAPEAASDGPLGHLYEWNVPLDAGIPKLHIPRFGAERAELLAALADDDEDAADTALQRVLGAEVALFALLELADQLAGPGSQHLPRELRATYLDQCLRMAKRRAPGVVKDTPIRELRTALEAGELAPELLARARVLAASAGIFAGTVDATERALLDELAARPDDAGIRSVYADHLEERGDLARAEGLRAETNTPPLPDARERGFIAPLGLPPVDTAARIRDHAAQWRADDPTTSIEPLLAHVAALHPTARMGYELLAVQLERWRHGGDAHPHLLREIASAWPQLVLGLRRPRASPQLLVDGAVAEAAPYLLALALRPSAETRRVAMAEAYLELGGEADAALIEQLLPHTRADAEPDLRAVAFVLLRDSGADDRVFDAYLANFCDAYPHSERALKKRRKDPRVLETLLAALAREETASLADGRHLRYTPEYGILAKYLSRLGNARGREAAKRFQQRSRWGKGGWPEEM